MTPARLPRACGAIWPRSTWSPRSRPTCAASTSRWPGCWPTRARPCARPRARDFLWVRALDMPACCRAPLRRPSDQLVLEVDDPLGLSGGRFALEGGPHGATCRRPTPSADLSLSMSALGASRWAASSLHVLARGRAHRGGAQRAPGAAQNVCSTGRSRPGAAPSSEPRLLRRRATPLIYSRAVRPTCSARGAADLCVAVVLTPERLGA